MKSWIKYSCVAATAILLFIAIASCSDKKATSAQKSTQQVTEEYSQAAVEAVPYPLEVMKAGGWLERMNLRERLIRYSKADKISYIYLFSEQGQLLANYTVKGKVSSASSQMTTSQNVNDYCGTGECQIPIDSPLDDGTWGPSEDAVFFFTSDGVMVQWNGSYVLADAPLDLTTKPVLVYNTGSSPSSVGDEKNYGG